MSNDLYSILWFRNDLRLSDNPALIAALQRGRILPIYILDDHNANECAMGGASSWWLHHALNALNEELQGQLTICRGDPLSVLQSIITQYPISAVYWNRCYEPWQIKRDKKIKAALKLQSVEGKSYNASLLWEPWTIQKKDGTPYKVFTPYYRKGCLQSQHPRFPLAAPHQIHAKKILQSLSLNDLGLLPKIRWDNQLAPHWDISEKSANECLETFVHNRLPDYQKGRDYPSQLSTSRLSPYLHFGQISPHQVWHAANAIAYDENVDTFCSELGWREFSYYLLYHNPVLPHKNLQPKFDHFPWQTDEERLVAWQQGKTGIPMVDAGMRELWQTGSMHNRLRMIVASFLVKNLRLHWHLGAHWFWDCLVDADLASNSASWQWVAGCGSDAAPYFRIFNPVTQGQKFDPEGNYIRHYLPELANLPNKYLFSPWTAPASILSEAGIVLGTTYPNPIVDLQVSRKQALDAFKSL